MNSSAPKYTSLELFLKSLSIESLDHWDHIQNSLKERKNQLKQELSSIKAKEKELEKAEAKAKKEQEKTEAKSNKEVKTINTSSFKNFTIWTSGINGQDNASQGAPTQQELDSYGGRREWKKTKWAELTKDQKDDPAAPWNCC